jgi:hypothetical protein
MPGDAGGSFALEQTGVWVVRHVRPTAPAVRHRLSHRTRPACALASGCESWLRPPAVQFCDCSGGGVPRIRPPALLRQLRILAARPPTT